MKPPHWLLALSEAPRALLDYSTLALSRPLLRKLPRGDGHGVMVIPGFMGDDPFNQPLVDFLNQLGYRASGWQLGRNRPVRASFFAWASSRLFANASRFAMPRYSSILSRFSGDEMIAMTIGWP